MLTHTLLFQVGRGIFVLAPGIIDVFFVAVRRS